MNHNIVYLSVKFSAGAATFEYDAKGRQVMSAYGSGLSTLYNILDLPQRQTTGDGTVVDYKYAFDGRKLQEKVTACPSTQPSPLISHHSMLSVGACAIRWVRVDYLLYLNF